MSDLDGRYAAIGPLRDRRESMAWVFAEKGKE